MREVHVKHNGEPNDRGYLSDRYDIRKDLTKHRRTPGRLVSDTHCAAILLMMSCGCIGPVCRPIRQVAYCL
jgi:hypothetical protein